jgi:tetratricopeptide (TPR) repeat protein
MQNFYVVVLVLFSNFLLAQSPVDSLVQLGIQCHDNGQYDKAIELYQKALEIDPASPLTNYEIALTYMYAKDYANSIKHSDIVIGQKGQNLLQAYVTKGSCLDYLGKTDESIRLFEQGIRKFGDHYLLYYNLGYDYYKLKNYEKAQEVFTKAIKSNPNHASSHLFLGFTMADLDQKVQSLLCLHYFLLLEPNSGRAKTAFSLLQKQFLRTKLNASSFFIPYCF